MQKRVVGNINELNEAARKTASEESANTAGTNRGGSKANKTSFGKFKKFAVVIMLLIVSVFCAIGSADWIISQQENLPGGSDSTFIYDKKTLQNYIALKGSDEAEAAAKAAEAEEYASLKAETDSDDSAAADKLAVKKAAVSKKTAASAYANGLESAIYGKSAIYNGKPIVAIKKTAGIDNAAAELPDEVLKGSLLTSYKSLTDGSVTEDSLDETYFAEGATSGLPKDAGTYAILIKIKGLEAYGYAVKIFTILPCPVTVEWSGVDFANGFTYDGTAHSVTATAKIASSDNGNAEGTNANTSVSYTVSRNGTDLSYPDDAVKNAGSYTLTAFLESGNYVINENKTVNFTVKKAPLIVTVNGKTITYGDNLPEFTLLYSGFVNGETVSVLGGKAICTHEYEQFSNVGTYTVTASGLTSENYEITYEQGTLTVKKYGLELSWSPLTFVYDKNSHVPTAAITNRLPSGAADYGLNVSVTTGEAINAGSYTAKASVPDDGNYYISSGETTNFTVTAKKATATVNLSKTEIVFGSEAPTATITYDGVLDGDTLGTPEFDYGGYKKGSDVKTYTVTVKGLANGNYDIKTTPASFTVKPYGLNVTWSDLTFTYDKTAHKPTSTVSNPIDGLTAPVIAVTTNPLSAINAGSYTATASVANTNYYITDETKSISFTIGKRTASVTVNPKSITYGSEVPSYSASDLVTDNLIGDDKILGEPTFDLVYVKGSPAGEYTVTVTFNKSKINANYKLSENVVYGILTVNKAPLTVKADDKTITYGDDLPKFTASYSGFVNGETSAVLSGVLGFTCDYAKGSPVGTYDVKPQGLTSENYEITYVKGLLTVNQKAVGIAIDDKTITYGNDAPSYSYQYANLTVEEALEISKNITFNCAYTKGTNAGKYEIDAKVNLSSNYSFNITKGTLTVNKAPLTVVAKANKITYGDAPSAKGYYFEGFVCGDTQATANIAADVTFSYDYKQNGDIYDTDGNKIDYAITPIINSFTSTNYTCTLVRNGKLTVNKLAVSLNVIKSNYASGGLTFDKSLFNGAFTSNNSQVDLSKAYEAVISNESKPITAKNFTGTADTSKAENGYFSYSFGTAIKVGSTYIIENIALADKCNYTLTPSKTYTYLKYQTAKIGDNFYTIEDALAQSGDIHLAGDPTDKAYVITAFSKLGLSSSVDSAFSDYKYDYAYTLNGKKLVASYNDSTTTRTTDKSVTSYGNVYSALILHKNITLTLSSLESSSATLAAAATVGFDQNISTTLANIHGVIMNNGKIIVNSGCTVEANGYIKGGDKSIIELKSGATAIDALSIYDWPGGTAAMKIYKNVFPTNAYTVHNISCPVKVYSGAIYKANVFLTASTSKLDKDIIIVGSSSTSSSKGMFNADDSSGYVMKSVTTNAADKGSSKDINYNITLSNQRAEKSVYNTFNHRDNIVVNGKYSDSPVSIKVLSVGLQTSTSIPLPIGFMDITIKENASLTLTSSDYLILPGATLKIESKGTLNLGSNVDLTAMSYSSMPTGGRGFINYYTSATDGSGKQDGKLIVNGTLTGNDYNLGGNILTESENSTLTVFNASGSYVTMISYNDPYYKSGTLRAVGNIITGRDNYGEANFSTGTYYSKNVGTDDSPVYAWFKNTATVTYVLNGGTLNGSQENYIETVTFTANGYTNMPAPSKPYYEFGGWFFDSDLSETATSVYTSCTLYAKWNPIEYTVKYHFASSEYGTLNDEKLSGNEIKALSNPPKELLTINGTTLAFSGWYLTSDYSGNSVSSVSAANADSSKIINVYANFINADTTYNVFFELNPEGITDNTVGMIPLDFDKKSVHKGEATEISSLVDILSIHNYNTDYKSNYYFSGWYLSTDETQTVITVLPSTISEDLTLYAKWEKKTSVTVRSSIEVSLKTSDGQTEVAIGTGEEKLLYLYKGATLSLEDKKELHKNGFNSTKTVYTEHSLILSETENGTNAAPYSITNDITLYIRCDEVTYHQVDITVRLGNSYKGWFGTYPPKAASVTINSNSYYDINGEKKTGNITLENSTEKAGDEKYLSVYLPIGTYTPSGSNTASITPTIFTITKDTTKVTTVLAQGNDRTSIL